MCGGSTVMDSDFDRASEQIKRASLYRLPLWYARIGAAPVLSLRECRKLSRETCYTVDQLRAEFVGFECPLNDAFDDLGEAIEDFKREASKPFRPIVRWLVGRLGH